MPSTTLSSFQPSPKRKRDQQQAPPPPLPTSSLRAASTPTPPRGCTPDSPRNAVADQLRGMSLTSLASIPMSPLSPMEDVVHKKPKLDAPSVDYGTSLDAHVAEAKMRTHNKKKVAIQDEIDGTPRSSPDDSRDREREIPETPQLQPRIFPDSISFSQQLTSFGPSLLPDTASSYQSFTPTHYSPKEKKSTHRPKSPSPPLSSLTWKDSEITGHMAGPSTDPDDDGTGLNGIGFQPTPAIAYARAQKRRQQVLDWKAREAREARAKRSERRRRGVGGASSRETTVEREIRASAPVMSEQSRSVKFAV